MKQWLMRAGQIVLGAVVGSLLLENVTRLATWQFVSRVHDVQFALLIAVISTIGGVLGGIVAVALLLVKGRRFSLAGFLVLFFGGLGVALSLPQIIYAQQIFDENNQPFIDALAYGGFTFVFSVSLFFWSVLLLLKKVGKAS